MKSRLLHEVDGQRTFAAIFSRGEEVIAGLLSFARAERVGGCRFTGIGAFEHSVIAYFNWETKEYEKRRVDEQTEVLSLAGNITVDEAMEGPKVHAHVVLGKRDLTAHGGHLMEAVVRPTLEVLLIEVPRHLQRAHDPESGLALIKDIE